MNAGLVKAVECMGNYVMALEAENERLAGENGELQERVAVLEFERRQADEDPTGSSPEGNGHVRVG